MLSEKELEEYRSGWKKRQRKKEKKLEQKKEQGRQKAQEIARLLKEKYGAKQVILNGLYQKTLNIRFISILILILFLRQIQRII